MEVPLAAPPIPPLPGPDSAKTASVRRLGWLLVVLGAGLSIGMAWIGSSLANTIAHNAAPGSTSHWNGDAHFTRTTFELFAAIFVFGVVAIAGGVYQIRTGMRSRLLIVLTLVIVAVIVALGAGIMTAPTGTP